jgi:hypothetical protein
MNGRQLPIATNQPWAGQLGKGSVNAPQHRKSRNLANPTSRFDFALVVACLGTVGPHGAYRLFIPVWWY